VVRPSPLSRTAFGPTSRRPAKIRCHRPAAAAASTEFDQLIKDSHDEAFNEVGLDVGTPVLRIADTTLFGPVVTSAPPRGHAESPEQVGEELMKKNAGLFVVPEFHAAEVEYLVSAELIGL